MPGVRAKVDKHAKQGLQQPTPPSVASGAQESGGGKGKSGKIKGKSKKRGSRAASRKERRDSASASPSPNLSSRTGGIVRPSPSSSGVRDWAASIFASASSASRQSGKKFSCFTGGQLIYIRSTVSR